MLVKILRNLFAEISITNKTCPRKDNFAVNFIFKVILIFEVISILEAIFIFEVVSKNDQSLTYRLLLHQKIG